MTVTGLSWLDGSDIHLLPGLVSPRLDQLLLLAGPNVQAADRDSRISVAFHARIAGDPGDLGVSVDPDWGEVAVAGKLPPGPLPRSFVIDVTVTDPGPPGSTEPPVQLRSSVRVHVHEAIERMWLTPSPLTVHQNARGPIRFTVLAKFGDGVIGDITNWTRLQPVVLGDATCVRANGSDTPQVVWSSGPGSVTAEEESGLLKLDTATGQATTITARRPLPEPIPPNAQASADALPAGPWTDSVRVDPVQGGGFAAIGDEGIRNVLFLPDGFTHTERTAFERCVRVMVSRLSVRGRTRPWDLLKGTFNYFRAWVQSPQAGITVLPEQDRVLLNECDTAFHATMGERPTLTPLIGSTSMLFGSRRLDPDDFDRFLQALTDDQGHPLRDSNPWPRGRKDENLIVIVCRTLRHGGTNAMRGLTGKVLFVTLGDEGSHRMRADPGGDGFDLRPDTIPAVVPVDPWTTVAHELAHSFGLGDEYGNQGYGGKTSLPSGEAGQLVGMLNVQAHSELLVAGKLVTTSPTNPKWGAWPRIAKAGVLAADAEDLSGGSGEGPFVLQLQPGHGALFAEADIIRLRRRPLVGAGEASARLEVTGIDVDRLTAVRLETGTIDPDAFPAGATAVARRVPSSIVIVPVRAPDPLPGLGVYGDDLGLVAESVRQRIDATHNPLNAADTDQIGRACRPLPLAGEPYKRPTEATNFPGGAAPKPPPWSPWIIGLYEGGHGYDCGAYRPAGICMMRRGITIVDPDPDDPTNPEDRIIYQFCTVCRYAIVDQLDPSKHGDLDLDYAPRYPA